MSHTHKSGQDTDHQPRNPYQLQSLDRAMAVLDLISMSDTPLSLAEICARMQLHKSTVHRSLMVLESRRLIERNADNHYRLGIKLYDLGNRAVEQIDLRVRIQPFLRRLSAQLGKTVHLGILKKTSVVYLDKAEPNPRVCMNSKTGTSNPVYCTAMGKAMLAYLPPQAVEATISKIRFIRFTQSTICSKEELLKVLERVRARGYAIDDEELELGVRCVGSPIFDHYHMPIAALSVSESSARVHPHTVPLIVEKLQRCCADISACLKSRSRKKTPPLSTFKQDVCRAIPEP